MYKVIAVISAAHHLCIMFCVTMHSVFLVSCFYCMSRHSVCSSLREMQLCDQLVLRDKHSTVPTYVLGRHECTSLQFGKRKKADKQVTIVKQHTQTLYWKCIQCMYKENAASGELLTIICHCTVLSECGHTVPHVFNTCYALCTVFPFKRNAKLWPSTYP